MSWSTLATNQMVSELDAAGGGFTLKVGQIDGTTNKCMSKLEATTKYNLLLTSLSSYTDNQLIPRIAWTSGYPYSFSSNSSVSIDSSATGLTRAGIFITTDGTKIMTLHTDGKIRKYLLSIPFVLSSLTYSQISASSIQINWGTGDVFGGGLSFNSTGTKLYSVRGGSSAFHLFEHTLSTAYDLSTINYTPNAKVNFPWLTTSGSPKGTSFSEDGRYLIMAFSETISGGAAQNLIVKGFYLNTAWSISTINSLSGETGVGFTVSNVSWPTIPFDSPSHFDRSSNSFGAWCTVSHIYNAYRLTYNSSFNLIQDFSSPSLGSPNSIELMDMPNPYKVFTIDATNVIRRYDLNAKADVSAPTAPLSLSYASLSYTTLTLNWAAATDNVDVVNYLVFKDGVLLATLGNVLTYNVTGLTSATFYSFTVYAKDLAGNISPASNTTTATTLDNIVPSTPGTVVISSITSTTLTTTWGASTDNVGVTGYKIYVNGSTTPLVTLGNVLTYNVTGLTASTSYYFTVKAFDAAGNLSAGSTSSTITTSAPANSVTFSSYYSASGTSGTTNFSGTVTIVGTTATFKAFASVYSGYPCNVSINVGGNIRTAYQPTIGTNTSTTFTLNPGTYSYSGSVTITSGYCQGGIQYPTQP